MRKLAIIAIITMVSFGLIVPVMAADLDVAGHFRTRGFYKSNATDALTKDGASDAYYDFRFRPELTITVNDKIKINSRVVIFDEEFGKQGMGGSAAAAATGRNFETEKDAKSDVAQWDRAWASIITPYGKLDIGRMSGGKFGLSLFETEYARDRIKWIMPIGDVSMLGIIEKNVEGDPNVNPDDPTIINDSGHSELDSSAYYLGGVYKTDTVETGLLLGMAIAEDAGTKTTKNVMIPYFDVKINNFGIKGELMYQTGTVESKTPGSTDTDIAAMGYYLAFTGNFGRVNAEIGYACAQGDDNIADNEISALGLMSTGNIRAGLGDEWVPLIILQDINGLLDAGNYNVNVSGTDVAMSTGVNLIYASADFAINKDLKLTAVIGNAVPNVKNVDTKSDDPFGNEIDLKLEWKIADAVTYTANVGYLMAGDYFKVAGSTEDPEDTHTIFHTVQVDF